MSADVQVKYFPYLHLILNFARFVGEVDGGLDDGCAHLGLCAEQRGDEGGEKKGGLGPSKPGGHVTRHTEIWVLVDRARDQSPHPSCPLAAFPGAATEAHRECGPEGWGSLDRREAHFPDVVLVREPEDSLRLRIGHVLLDLQDRLVKLGALPTVGKQTHSMYTYVYLF